MCAPPIGGVGTAGLDLRAETVIAGTVLRDGVPVGGAYVRLLDGSGEFTAEVVSSADGGFRFFAAPGRWTLSALAPGGRGSAAVEARRGAISELKIELAG